MALSMILVVANVAAADGSTAGAPRLATLSGGAEVGGGDADGSGFASIRLNVGRGRVCWDISFADIDAPFAAHIHVGAAGVNGPVVVPLNPNTPGCNEADPELIQAIIDFPANYYVNVHNTPFPGGAIRGQLSNPGLA
jgi:hypothetical protein